MSRNILQDHILMSKVAGSHFRISGFSHIAMEHRWQLSDTFTSLLETGENNVKAVLGIHQDTSLSLNKIKIRSNLTQKDKSALTQALRDIQNRKPGIILKITLPTCSPCVNNKDFIYTNYTNPNEGYTYGETYEEALLKAYEFSDKYIKISLAYQEVMFAKHNTVSTTIKEATVIKRFSQLLKKTRR